jgi:hypothetical protein
LRIRGLWGGAKGCTLSGVGEGGLGGGLGDALLLPRPGCAARVAAAPGRARESALSGGGMHGRGLLKRGAGQAKRCCVLRLRLLLRLRLRLLRPRLPRLLLLMPLLLQLLSFA